MKNATIQLELGLNSESRKISAKRQRYLQRARWWFQQMHRTVDKTVEWQAAPAPPALAPSR